MIDTLGLILAQRSGIAAVLWTTLAMLLLFAVLEIFSRTAIEPADPAPRGGADSAGGASGQVAHLGGLDS